MSRGARQGLAAAGALVLLSVGLSACAGQEQSGTPAHRVSTWVSGAGAGSNIGAIESDNRSVDRALAAHAPTGDIRTVCAVLSTDADSGNDNLPTPDTQLTDALNDAYEIEYAAGTDCYNGASGNKSLLRRSAKERSEGAADLTRAVARITAVTGQVPSTTTTTSPDEGNADPFGGD